jgi:hypothetical protein
VGANHAAAVEPPLDERLLADDDAVADLERLGVLGQRTAADADSVAEPFRQRPPHRAAHAGVGGVIAVCVRRGQVEQLLPCVIAPQPIGELELVGTVGFDRLPCVHRRHQTTT